MRKYVLWGVVLATGLLLFKFVQNLWPVTYYDNNIKVVEYYHGESCVYLDFDKWNDAPIHCLPTIEMRKMHPPK